MLVAVEVTVLVVVATTLSVVGMVRRLMTVTVTVAGAGLTSAVVVTVLRSVSVSRRVVVDGLGQVVIGVGLGVGPGREVEAGFGQTPKAELHPAPQCSFVLPHLNTCQTISLIIRARKESRGHTSHVLSNTLQTSTQHR